MSEATADALSEVARVLDAYLPSEELVARYVAFFSCDTQMFRACSPQDVGMLVAALEGHCDNPPAGKTQAASVSAWAYCQVGSLQAQTHAEFMASVQSLLADAASDQSGVLLTREPIEELAAGFGLMTAALEEGEADSVLSRALEGVGGLLDAVVSRADLDYETSYEGTVVVEDVVVEWLLNRAQEVLDYAAAMKSVPGLDVDVRDGLEEALESLTPALQTFTEDAG